MSQLIKPFSQRPAQGTVGRASASPVQRSSALRAVQATVTNTDCRALSLQSRQGTELGPQSTSSPFKSTQSCHRSLLKSSCIHSGHRHPPCPGSSWPTSTIFTGSVSQQASTRHQLHQTTQSLLSRLALQAYGHQSPLHVATRRPGKQTLDTATEPSPSPLLLQVPARSPRQHGFHISSSPRWAIHFLDGPRWVTHFLTLSFCRCLWRNQHATRSRNPLLLWARQLSLPLSERQKEQEVEMDTGKSLERLSRTPQT